MALITITNLFFGPVLGYMIWTVTTWQLNVRKARQLNVPYICVPVDGNNPLWTIFQPCVWSKLDRLPFKWPSYPKFVRYSRRGWEYTDISDTHVYLGPVWALVTPVAVYLQFADPGAVNEIFTRRSDFVRPVEEYKLLEVYGPCISTAGDDWPRHRRVIAAPFNESIMEFVWNESLRQVRSMLCYWSSAGEPGIPSIERDTRTLSLNVLASIAFCKPYTFHGSTDPKMDEASSYRDSLQTVLDNIVPLMLIPYRFLTGPATPKRWARVGDAAVSFKRYMAEMLEKETTALEKGKPGSGGIMTPFAHALKQHDRGTNPKLNTDNFKRGVSVDEIFGNVFVIDFAGHDTIAVTLAFSMILFLAANPLVLDWVSDEISTVTKDVSTEEWDYKTLFPALNRYCAILFETLRLYPPIMGLPKSASRRAQTVKPSRWIFQATSTPPPSLEGCLNEQLLMPKPNTFFPWSDGPQKCPGRKVAEVEAAAVFACLFKEHRLFIKKRAHESNEAARQRAIARSNRVRLEALLKMADADRITLVCKKV